MEEIPEKKGTLNLESGRAFRGSYARFPMLQKQQSAFFSQRRTHPMAYTTVHYTTATRLFSSKGSILHLSEAPSCPSLTEHVLHAHCQSQRVLSSAQSSNETVRLSQAQQEEFLSYLCLPKRKWDSTGPTNVEKRPRVKAARHKERERGSWSAQSTTKHF